MRFSKSYLVFLVFIAVTLWSCKKWDDHISVQNQNLNVNLMDYISNQQNLKKFTEYLIKTGLDKTISASKNFTVFAPTDNALQSLAPDVINDTAKLKAFLSNHISEQLFFTRMAVDSFRVKMINGKRNFFIGKKFDDANIIQADVYVRNGVIQTIDKAVPPLQNIWEFIQSNKATYTQNNYVSTLNYESQDPNLAVLDSINPITGQPVYKPNTGIVKINTFLSKVYDVSNEDSLYTYILLNNAAFKTETDKQLPYFKSPDNTLTISNASWNIVKDLSIKGRYASTQLPLQLTSKFNVRIPLSSALVVETIKVSNGIVYVVNANNTSMAEKIPEVVVQGETPVAFSSNSDSRIAKTFYRSRFNSLTGLPFTDIYLNNGSSGTNSYIDYTTNNIYTTTYKVYWVAFSDKVVSGQGDDAYGTDQTFLQLLSIGADSSKPYAPTFTVQGAVKPNILTETYLGEYTNLDYNFLLAHPIKLPSGSVYTFNAATRRLRLQAPATVTTGVPLNLTLDYVKLVPVF